jgi:mono/diheme cytochrome c family protein
MTPRPLALIAAAALLLPCLRTAAAEAPSFSRDVMPILSDNCFGCHGPDESHRKAKLRLDTREGATALNDGVAAIVPGDRKASELLTRIITGDPDEIMPPPKSHKPKLRPAEIDVLARWIDAGAPWGKHWAFEKPVRPPLANRTEHPIDALVQARLAKEGLALSPVAPPHTLARRVSLDLTGLPLTPEEAAALTQDPSPATYAQMVDRLLASPHFGERMAMWWLDAARYADTDGFQGDATRVNWPWRDWVVGAFNRNLPFDQFTIEQFAGDLLPGATAEQKLATCFHRNHMTNGEGGRDPEESRIDYVRDRVNTVGTVWLGLTLQCAQCHTHKFDPITQADYYSLNAFFDSIDEDGKAGRAAKPYLAYESPLAARGIAEAQSLVDERKPRESAARKAAEQPFEEWLTARAAEVREGFSAWHGLRASALESSEGTLLAQEEDGAVQTSGPNPKQDDYRLIAPVTLSRITGLKLEVLPHPTHTEGKLSRGASGEFILTDIKLQVRRRGSSQIRDIAVTGAVADVSSEGGKKAYGSIKDTLDDDPRNGWTTKGADPLQPHVAVFALAEPLVLGADEELILELRHRSTLGDANTGRFRVSVTDQRGPAVQSLDPAPLEQLAAAQLADDLSQLDPKLRARLSEQFLSDYPPYVDAKEALDRANRQLNEAKAAKKVDVMVLAERKEPRETHVLVRGVWDKKGDKVRPDVPAAIAPWNGAEQRSRLELAQWIVSPENPLTARVIANHLWQLCFGAGLVRTVEDFGLQGERPAHPELLDWLAVELVESGWDVKHLLKVIVTSRTYRQRSDVTPALLARDPDNRLLARGARYRLPSWMLRDAALKTAGLLNPALGGAPVKPYQPEGVWEEMFMGRFRYEPSDGAAQYRRTLYAFWRRAIAPTFLFDSAQRRVCEVSTARTNTPLQALTLLNDASQREAAQVIAGRALRKELSVTPIQSICQAVLLRLPRPEESDVLQRALDQAIAHYRKNPGDAAKVLQAGQSLPDPHCDPAALAAHTLVATMVLNLDEAITHE